MMFKRVYQLVKIKKQEMDQYQSYHPYDSNIPNLFQQQDYADNQNLFTRKDQIIEDECNGEKIIDQQLLQKTSLLHQALRNKKLHQFELIQAKIMRQTNPHLCQQIIERITETKLMKSAIVQNRKNIQKQIKQIEQQIKLQLRLKKQNQQMLDRARHYCKDKEKKIQNWLSQNRETKQNTSKKDCMQIQSMKLKIQNQIKSQTINDLKSQITQAKTIFKSKKTENQELQREYKDLLGQLQNMSINVSVQSKKGTDRQIKKIINQDTNKQEIRLTETYQIEKQNDINHTNTLINQSLFNKGFNNKICYQSMTKPKKQNFQNYSLKSSTLNKDKKCL